jgi:hypothetical protein
MILDLGTGYHDAQAEYLTLGFGLTWVSGDSPAGQAAATSGWSYTAFAGNKGHAAFDGNKGHVAMDAQK